MMMIMKYNTFELKKNTQKKHVYKAMREIY